MPVRTPMYELPLSQSDQEFIPYFNQHTVIVVIIFQLFKACYSVQEYTCVNKHMIFDSGTKKH